MRVLGLSEMVRTRSSTADEGEPHVPAARALARARPRGRGCGRATAAVRAAEVELEPVPVQQAAVDLPQQPVD